MNEVIVKRQSDLGIDEDPMGESLANRANYPVRAWVNEQYGLVLGASQKPEIELNLTNVLSDLVPIYRRSGGGGTVLLGPRGFCYGIRLKKIPKFGIHDYLNCGTGLLQGVLKDHFGIETHQKGTADLCIGDRKILGCSLYMPRDFAMYYASVLYQDESERIEKYLAHPSREPEYRAGRRHGQFVTSLEENIPNLPTQDWFCHAILERALAQLSDVLDFK